MSTKSSAEISRTNVPRRGRSSTSPSWPRRRSASRTGPRLISSSSAIRLSTRCSPIAKRPAMIDSRIEPYASSTSDSAASGLSRLA
jgi:hypothetical protein